ncbi:MAG: hypothetical protein ACE37M_11495 [Henriciella sp.]
MNRNYWGECPFILWLIGCFALWFVPSFAVAQGSYLNETLIEETAAFDPEDWRPIQAKDLPNLGERVSVSPQNRGVLLYAEDSIAVFNRGNVRTREQNASGRPISKVIPEGPICSAPEWHREWRQDSTRYNIAPVAVPSMHVVVVINELPTFEISREWFDQTLKPVIRDQVVENYCGGKTVSVQADIWLVGLQHSSEGEIFNIAEFAYPEYRVGANAREHSSFQLNAGAQSLRIRPYDAGFATGFFYFWDNLLEPKRTRLKAMDFDTSEANTLSLSLGFGVSEFANGKIKTLTKKWERLSYADYNWHQAQSAKRTQDVLAARQEAEDLAKAFIAGLAILQFRNYCYGNDTPWWAWDLHDVWQRRELDACKHYFGE